MPGFRPVDPKQSFPELEERVLERWRERDVFAPLARAAARAPTSGASTRARRPPTAGPAPTTSSPASSRTSTRATARCAATACRARRAGTATACRSSSRSRRSSGISSKARDRGVRDRRVQPALPRVGLPLRRGLEPADRADRLLDRPRRPLRDARERLHRVGLVVAAPDLGRRAASTRATRSSPTARAAAPRSPRTRSRRATRTSRTPPSTCSCRSRAARATRSRSAAGAGDSLLVWTTTPWTLISNAAVAVGPEIEYVRAPSRRTRSWCWPRALVEQVLGEDAEVLAHFPGEALAGTAYEPPVRLHHRLRRRAATPVARRRLRHHRRRHRPRPHRDRLRRGRLPARRAVRDHAARTRSSLDGTFDERVTDFAGRFVKDADPRHRRRRCERRGLLLRAEQPTSTPIRTAGAATRRSSTTRSRAGTSRTTEVRDQHARRERDDRLAPRAHQARPLRQVAGEQRRLGALARPLLGHAAADLGVRPARTATSASAPARSPSCASAAARSPTTCTGPTSTRSSLRLRAAAAARCAGSQAVIDAWFDSGAMPFAQFHYPFENEELFEERFPADFICEAIDQTRGWFYTLLAESTLLFDQSELPQLRLPRPDPRPRGPEDVEEPRQRGRSLGGDRRATAPTPSAGTTSPPSSPGPATASRSRRSASRCASSC